MYTNVSSEFLEVLARPSRHFAARFSDNGTVIDLNIKNMKVTTGTCGGGKLAVGCAYAAYIDVTAVYTDLLLEGKELLLELGLLLDDDSYEWIPFGYWTVQKPKKSMDTMTFQAVDRMAGKLFADYETALTYPATIQAILAEFATNTGLTVHCNLQTSQYITVPIQGVTQRGALAVIAATLLGNAWIDRNGDVQITSIGGGTSVQVNYDYVKGQPEMDEESTEIEGVKVYTVAGQIDTWIERGSGNMVEVSDVYMTDTTLDAVKANLIGLTYGGGEVSFMGNPLLDPSDIVYFRGGSDMVEYFLVTELDAEITDDEDVSLSGFDFTSYDIPCLEITQSFDGGLLTTVSAPGQFEITEQTYTVGAVTEELRRQAKEITTTQAEVQTAQQSADNAMITANGKNRIYYQNDAPTSGMGEGDLWFDTDGGNAIYEYKKTASNPDTYAWTLRQLGQGSIAAGSITANEINVNNLSAISGILGSVTVGGASNVDGSITIKDASNNNIGKWDNENLALIVPAESQHRVYWTRLRYIYTVSGSDQNIGSLSAFVDRDSTDSVGMTLASYGRLDLTAYNSIVFYPDYGNSTKRITFDTTGGILFNTGADSGVLKNTYNSTTYNLIRNHNNGNISVSASCAGLYLGYENTTIINFFNGAQVFNTISMELTNPNSSVWIRARNSNGGNGIFIQANIDGSVELASNCANGTRYAILQRANNSNAITAYGLWTFSSQIISSVTSGQAAVYASNSGTGNRIFIYADASNGQVGLYSYSADNTARAILVRDNNSNAITAYGAWTFNTGIKGNNNYTGIPVLTESSGASRISYMASASGYVLRVNALWGGSSYATASATLTSSDIRLKEHIKNSTVKAMPIVDAINIREFDWKDGRHQRIGFIADELEKLDKNLAVGGGKNEDGTMNIKSVDTFYLLGYAIKAIQELSAEVKKLKKGVA